MWNVKKVREGEWKGKENDGTMEEDETRTKAHTHTRIHNTYTYIYVGKKRGGRDSENEKADIQRKVHATQHRKRSSVRTHIYDVVG